jgi:hypothetical protein
MQQDAKPKSENLRFQFVTGDHEEMSDEGSNGEQAA